MTTNDFNIRHKLTLKMNLKIKIISLLTVILMVTAAAICVNKTIFGHNVTLDSTSKNVSETKTDTITVNQDGTIVIHSANLPNTISGYAGPVPLDIYVADGKITDIKALPNAESPSFFNRAATLFKSWIGKTPEEAAAIKVDGVTGATYSSAAIINNVKVSLNYYDGVHGKSKSSVPWKIWVALAVTLSACVVPLFFKNKTYHTVQLCANVIVLGFWCGQFLDYSMILKYLSDGFIFPVGLVAVAMLIAAFIYPIFGHPQHYCNHICPLGSAQQLTAQICHYKIHITPKVLKGLDWFRRILWAVLMLLLWADSLIGWMDLELFQAFQFRSAPWWIIGAALFFVALSTVVSRPYCRFVCPTGSLFKRSENFG